MPVAVPLRPAAARKGRQARLLSATAPCGCPLSGGCGCVGRGWTGPRVVVDLLGLEVFNEVDKASTVYMNGVGDLTSPENTLNAAARLWAMAAREFVRGLQSAFADEGSGITLPLWLPSLAMYSDQGSTVVVNSPPTFATVLYFQQRLCSWLVELFGNDAKEFPDAPRVDFSWFQNQDYHYYNYRNNQAPGPIRRLLAETHALRQTFRDIDHGGTGVDALAGHRVTLSVCENGAPADYGNIDPTIFKYLVVQPTSMEPFQARELWRRLATAAITSRFVGWHTPMSYLEASAGVTIGFVYLGLRDDSGISDPAAGTYPPNASSINERLSWWVYQLFASLLCTVTTPPLAGQIVARWAGAAPSSSDYYRTYSGSSIDDMGIVIHFMVAIDLHYYLIMIDPCADLGFSKTVTLTVRRHHRADFNQIPSVPDPTAVAYGATPSNAWEFPRGSPNWAAPTLLASHVTSYTFPSPLGADGDPVLVSCSEVLDITWS